MNRFLSACTILLALTAPVARLGAQATPIRIEVASIHPHKATGDDPSNRNILPGGHFVATATNVQTLIRSAFGLDPNAILNAPGWTESETFDINATTAGHAEVNRPEQYQELLLSLLEDRFGFQFHRAQREGSVFWLVVDKPGRLGPGLKEGAPGTPLNLSMNGNRIITMRVAGVSMTDVAKSLQRRAGRTIEDRTGLKGTYDFGIQWATDASPDSDDPTLFTVLREQLGLRLQSAKGPVETLVVDHIERPSVD